MNNKLVCGLVGVILSLVFVPLYVNESFAGVIIGPPTSTLGDFDCRDTLFPGPEVLNDVLLKDQFVPTGIVYSLQEPDIICSAGQKVNASPFDNGPIPSIPNQHYLVYPLVLENPDFNIPIQLTDQFETTFHNVLAAHELWVPATKNHEAVEFPKLTDIHWLCYDITESTSIAQDLFFQFDSANWGIQNVQLNATFQMCNPVIKQVEDSPGSGTFTGPEFGSIIDEHMKCYDVQSLSPPTFDPTVNLFDQFNGTTYFVEEIHDVCLVADKQITGSQPVIGGSLIPIDIVSLFLGGAAINMFWILPVVGAGAGITIFTLRRNH